MSSFLTSIEEGEGSNSQQRVPFHNYTYNLSQRSQQLQTSTCLHAHSSIGIIRLVNGINANRIDNKLSCILLKTEYGLNVIL